MFIWTTVQSILWVFYRKNIFIMCHLIYSDSAYLVFFLANGTFMRKKLHNSLRYNAFQSIGSLFSWKLALFKVAVRQSSLAWTGSWEHVTDRDKWALMSLGEVWQLRFWALREQRLHWGYNSKLCQVQNKLWRISAIGVGDVCFFYVMSFF